MPSSATHHSSTSTLSLHDALPILNIFFLSNSINPICCLILYSWIPPSCIMDNMVSTSNCQTCTRCFRRQYEHFKSQGFIELVNDLLSVACSSINNLCI